MRRGRSELEPELGLRELDVRRAATSPAGSVFVVPGCSVMVVFPVLDGRFVEGSLLQGNVRAPQPGERCDRLGDDHDQHQDQHQDARGQGPRRSGTEEVVFMEGPS